MRKIIVSLAILVAACSGSSGATPAPGDLPSFDRDAFEQRLDEATMPMVINVWGSWCVPCRSEAPLLATAHETYGDEVEFIGINILDTQNDAKAFIEEFGITFGNLFDENGDIRQMMGGIGAPITYFVAPGGGLVDTHIGVIDEQQLALGIDELIARSDR